MTKTIRLVVADQVYVNEKISPTFYTKADVPGDFYQHNKFWGFITLNTKALDLYDPIAILEIGIVREPANRWQSNVFETGKGLFSASGFNENPAHTSLSETLANNEIIPDGCVLLTNLKALKPIQEVCDAKSITLIVHTYNGVLATSY